MLGVAGVDFESLIFSPSSLTARSDATSAGMLVRRVSVECVAAVEVQRL